MEAWFPQLHVPAALSLKKYFPGLTGACSRPEVFRKIKNNFLLLGIEPWFLIVLSSIRCNYLD
jgi:hypothetical protein